MIMSFLQRVVPSLTYVPGTAAGACDHKLPLQHRPCFVEQFFHQTFNLFNDPVASKSNSRHSKLSFHCVVLS